MYYKENHSMCQDLALTRHSKVIELGFSQLAVLADEGFFNLNPDSKRLFEKKKLLLRYINT